MFKLFFKLVKYCLIAVAGLICFGLIIFLFSGDEDESNTPTKPSTQSEQALQDLDARVQKIRQGYKRKSLSELEKIDDFLAKKNNELTQQLFAEKNQAKIDSLHKELEQLYDHVEAVSLEIKARKR